MRPSQSSKPSPRANLLSRPRRLAAVLAALVALAGASLFAAPIASASGVTVTIATAKPPPPPRPPAPPAGGPRPGGRPFQPCFSIDCIELANRVCRRLGVGRCKTPSERWRATRRDDDAFGKAITATVDRRPPGAGWTPHHIIPIHSRKAWVAQSIAFTNGISPNQGVNGVWLRGPALSSNQPGYDRLSRSQRRRTLHSDTFTNRYYRIVNTRLLGACPNARCSERGVRSALKRLRADLTAGRLRLR